jgi:hypothetical protein
VGHFVGDRACVAQRSLQGRSPKPSASRICATHDSSSSTSRAAPTGPLRSAPGCSRCGALSFRARKFPTSGFGSRSFETSAEVLKSFPERSRRKFFFLLEMAPGNGAEGYSRAHLILVD